MTLGTKVQEDGVVGVVEMSKNAEELGVDVPSDGGEGGGKFSACE